MCIARVGKVVSMDGGKAEVEFFDGGALFKGSVDQFL